jgi:methyl-accepting chemotaxis protein
MALRAFFLLALAVTLAAFAAGCGGSSQSPEEKYASSVCSNVTDWKDSVTKATDDITQQLKSPSAGMVDSVKSSVTSIVDATNTLSSNLKALGAPDTDTGKQAKQQVDSLATQLDQTVTEAKQKTDSLSSDASITDMISTFSSLAPSLQSLGTSAKNTLSSIQASAQAWKDGFQNADSCKPYR